MNNRWLEFYRWVQEQFDHVLERHATDDNDAEFDEPGPTRAPEAEPLSSPNRRAFAHHSQRGHEMYPGPAPDPAA